jgi:hypothetical protein
MAGEYFMFDGSRQERLLSRVDEILSRRGDDWQLQSRQDVLILAVQKLWTETVLADSETLTFSKCTDSD